MKSITLSLLIFVCAKLVAQVDLDSTSLKHNNVSAFVPNNGDYFNRFNSFTGGYELPKGSGHHPIYNMQLWFSGKDATGSIRTWRRGALVSGGASDLISGPYSDSGTYQLSAYQSSWGTGIWRISQQEIDSYKNWWEACIGPDQDPTICQNTPTPSNETLDRIFNWPAHGDFQMGQSYYLAPFYDLDSDGQYDPSMGDYPIIKGCDAIYLIQNDDGRINSFSGTDSLGIELHVMLYQYQTFDYLNDATFIEVKAVNRGNENYTDFVHSIYLDADIGYSLDDFFGCDSIRNCMYFYNGDNIDESNGSIVGYGQNPPAIGVVALSNNLTSCILYQHADPMGNWNQMHGLKPDSTSWINPNNEATRFVFSGNPNSSGSWNASTSGFSSGDYRGIASYAMGNFNSGDTLLQTYAIIYGREGNNLENVNNLLEIADQVKTFFLSSEEQVCIDGILNLNDETLELLKVYPNPTTGIVYVENKDMEELSVQVYNLSGQEVFRIEPSTDQRLELNLSEQSHGMYLMKIISSHGVRAARIMID